MESRTLQDGEPSFDQVQPRGIRWYPDKPYGLWFRLPQTDCLFVRTPVVPNQVDYPLGKRWQYGGLEKFQGCLAGLAGDRPSHPMPAVRGERRQQLHGAFALIAVGASGRSPTPTASASGNRLPRPHFVPADHGPVLRRIAVQAHDLVFFTSKSGSVLWHQVGPAR